MRLGTDLEGRAIIALNGRKDRCSLNIGELEDGSFSVWFRERGGDAGASLALHADGMAELRLHGREGKGSVQLLGAPGKGPSLVLSDQADALRLIGGLSDEGKPMLRLGQSDGRAGVFIGLSNTDTKRAAYVTENGVTTVDPPRSC